VSIQQISSPGHPASEARERLLAVAYELFSRKGIRAVGVDTIIARAGVAKMTFYHHFPSKNDLVLAFLQRRERLWTYEWLADEVTRRARAPRKRLLAIFDVFHDWFQLEDFEGCSFINVLVEMTEPRDPLRKASIMHLANIRVFLRQLADEARVRDPDDFVRKWHVLMKGSIVAAGEGDKLAASRARDIGRLLLAAHSRS
jgi:AcrR family transcriptional regulator